MPWNLGPTEMIFILVVLLVLFGAKRLPELGTGLGKGIREFKRSMRDINSEIERPEDPRIHGGDRSPAVGSGTTPQTRSDANAPAETTTRSAAHDD